MAKKIFKTLDEQISIFESKGLVVKNKKFAEEVLLRENYFFLNGYRHPFKKSMDIKTYIGGTTFEELYSLFLFDRRLRNILFKNILIIENNIKSIISYAPTIFEEINVIQLHFYCCSKCCWAAYYAKKHSKTLWGVWAHVCVVMPESNAWHRGQDNQVAIIF